MTPALAVKNPPSPGDPQPSHPHSETSQSLSLSLESIAARARELSLSWKAMNSGGDSLSWRTKWQGAQKSLDELQALSAR